MRDDAMQIIRAALGDVMPGAAVAEALGRLELRGDGRRIVIAVGKAAWEMARAALDALHGRVDGGVVITKYAHAKGKLDPLVICEAGHPVPDENGFRATALALDAVKNLCAGDDVLFLLSGGGSALLEKPLLPPQELQDVTQQLLACGADIVEMNTIRKRLSGVKGGRFALACAPARVHSIILSDIIGDPVDMIASGPTCPDRSDCAQAVQIARRCGLKLSDAAWALLRTETPKTLPNAECLVTGSVKTLCRSAAQTCRRLGYEPLVLTSSLSCEASEAGRFLAAVAREHQDSGRSLAFLAGGETVVHLKGTGKGGRNQELALAAAAGIEGCADTCVFSFGSDGTDGPTDAAGGYVDAQTAARLRGAGVSLRAALENNDAYHALRAVDGLIVTGPTGTNVNDLSVVLIRR